MKIFQLFPTYLYHASLPGPVFKRLNPRLEKECYTFRDLDRAGHDWSSENYIQGYTSYSSISDLPDRSPTFKDLKNQIDAEVKKMIKHLEWTIPFSDLTMSTCWINIMDFGCHHSFHLHPGSVLSGTYYVKVPKDTGSFKIEDPRIQSFMGSPPVKEKSKVENQRYFQFSPKAGELMLFESWLKHEVPANRSKTDRVSISFNYDWNS